MRGPNHARNYRRRHPDRVRASKKKWRETHLELAREKERRHGVARQLRKLAKRAEVFALQGNRCAACGSTEPGSKKGWHLDHCHKTGKLREFLCQGCNVAAGHANDDPLRLRMVADYLEKHNAG